MTEQGDRTSTWITINNNQCNYLLCIHLSIFVEFLLKNIKIGGTFAICQWSDTNMVTEITEIQYKIDFFQDYSVQIVTVCWCFKIFIVLNACRWSHLKAPCTTSNTISTQSLYFQILIFLSSIFYLVLTAFMIILNKTT